jgi:hypothetical protein
MTNEHKLNTLIEWTYEDRAKGECPVPDGSDVTVWFCDGAVDRDRAPQDWLWGEVPHNITAYLIHSVPREPLVAWGIVGGFNHGLADRSKEYISHEADTHGGRVVKLVEVME